MDTDRRKLFSILAHGSIFFSSTLLAFAVPIAILLISEDEIVQRNAKEAINFHINLYVFGVIFGALSFIVIGIPFLIGLIIVSFVFPIVAIVEIVNNPDRAYRYSLVFRLF
ncbi:MAG: DUF4870 domain-containing protein [Prochloraceae cyanobacterium]|nr:DUF4870 domain-containing protein [Prochloraceae cyanobacterium]